MSEQEAIATRQVSRRAAVTGQPDEVSACVASPGQAADDAPFWAAADTVPPASSDRDGDLPAGFAGL